MYPIRYFLAPAVVGAAAGAVVGATAGAVVGATTGALVGAAVGAGAHAAKIIAITKSVDRATNFVFIGTSSLENE
jgi:uncharacterized membrane protein